MDKLLEAEELAFLSELMAADGDESEGLSVQIPQASPLVPILTQAKSLNLVAEFEHHLLQFSVRLSVSEDMHPELVFDAPEIMEAGPTHRKWRFRPDASLKILDQHGNDSGLNVVDLADNSVSLQREEGDESLPDQMKLQLELPDSGHRVPLSARRVRELANGVAAYQLELQDSAQEDQLRWFLFSQHPARQNQARPPVQGDLLAPLESLDNS